MLLLFAFFGIEVALIPSGEVKNPARTVPRAIYLALAITTVLYLLIQFVAQGTLGPRLADDTNAPLAADRGHLPRAHRALAVVRRRDHFFVRVHRERHPQFAADSFRPRTRRHSAAQPAPTCIRVTALRTSRLSFTRLSLFCSRIISTFEALAVMANVAALLLYLVCCAAAFELMRSEVTHGCARLLVSRAHRTIPLMCDRGHHLDLGARDLAIEFKMAGYGFRRRDTLYLVSRWRSPCNAAD